MHRARRLHALYRAIYTAGIAVPFLLAGFLLWFGLSGQAWPLLLAVPVIAALPLFFVRRRLAEFRSLRHLPGPKPSFFLGNMGELLAYGHGGRHEALQALHDQYGPLVRLHLAWGSAAFVSLSYVSPNLHKKDLDSHRRADRTVLARSLMGVEGGDLHRTHRQVLSASLTSRGVAERSYVLTDVADRYVDKWKHVDETYEGIQADLRDWSVNCLSAFLFGEDWDLGADLHAYHRALGAIEEEVSFRAFHPFFVRWIFPRRRLRVRAAYRQVAGVLGAVLSGREQRAPAECPAHRPSGDLLGQVTRAPWSHEDRVEELMSLVLGGADPMSYVLSQALVMLSQDQHVQEKARKSIEAAAPADGPDDTDGPGGPGGDPSPDPYVRSIVYETLRLFPPVPFSAKFTEERAVEERGMSIPPGTVIMWMKSAVGKNPDLFRDADRFNPDRFSADDEEHATINSFLPFGAGPRHCVGNRLAEQQCAVMLTEILKNFLIVPVDDIEVTFHSTISVVPSAVPVRLVSR
ncbi:cytochrome P450 [Streptomyces sp. NBC_01408]|uniref:cytochrome P450 n=1 Tax=Streptomyces sp. NBC_01408 TaxID=2903855 RepID=UPI00225A00A7|nr:cytochrome P450 [Streptomyces sp. NBC_01408]MCX4695833.1 cytochrome P450 [Streptomyces sp. NBC_01408]